MAKQLNVNLAFTADTAKAKAQLKDLQRDLTNLINSTNKSSGVPVFSEDIQKASVAAATLKNQLTEATNVNTGKLDLGKFSQSLKQSGYQIKDYREALLTLGPDGDRVFSQLAQSIMMAEVPLRRSNALLGQFWVTLKNTARWQISSGILHGFMGTLQHAYGYAQDLNESLNNIRIVTGKSSDEMAKFAKEANNAAQALNTTTTEYTDAALIYYQQGLSDKEVQARTDITVKMANVSGQSAEEVSDQMTAIWNNFYDGSKSLEYYADTITALGAATASSSEEISEGLEKFASVADTVGLSYEYATAALATVTATTRQSADIVGNAFKTLFARIEGLNLGETLDDGTTLNKYSEALMAVGINIKDTNGDLKDMDQILDELGSKWQTLSKDQQVALAQTVAGVRQYTQLIALMDNWDFFGENLEVARDATGTLQEQADIYAESWEAARNRVKAASEEIYGQLLNDDFFIDLNDALAKTLNLVSDFIKGIGGLKGVLLALGTIALGVFKNQIANGLQNVVYNLTMMTKAGQQKIFQLRNETAEALKTMYVDIENPFLKETYISQAQAQEILLKNARNMTEEQQKIAQLLMDQHNTLVQNVIESEKIVETSQERINVLAEKQRFDIYNVISKDNRDKAVDLDIIAEKYKDITLQATKFSTVVKNLFPKNNDSKYYLTQLEKLKTLLGEDAGLIEYFGKSGANAFTLFEEKIREAEDDPKKLGGAIDYLNRKIKDFNNESFKLENELKQGKVNTREFTAALEENGKAVGQSIVNTIKATNSTESFENRINKIPRGLKNSSISIVKFAQGLSSVSMAINNITGLMDTWNNQDMSGSEKLLSSMTSLSFTLTSLAMVFSPIIRDMNALKAVKIADAAATAANTAATEAAKASEIALGKATLFTAEASRVAYNQVSAAIAEKIVAENLDVAAMTEEEKQELINTALKEKGIQVENIDTFTTKENTDAIIKNALAINANSEAKKKNAIASETQKNAMNASGLATALTNHYILAATIALVALAGGALIVAKHLEKVAERQKKAAEEASNLAKENSEQVKQNEELIKSYNNLISQYNKGYIQKEDLWDVTNKLSDAYNIEGGAIAKLTGQYDTFTEAVRKARLEEIEQQKQSAKEAIDANTLGAVAAGSKGTGTSFWTGGDSYSFDPNKSWLKFFANPTSFISNDYIRRGTQLALPAFGMGDFLGEVLPEELDTGISNNLKNATTTGKIRQTINVIDNLGSIINAFEEEGNLISGSIEADKILKGVREKEFKEAINKAGGTEGVLSIEDITSSSDVLNYYKSLEEARRILIEENGRKETDKDVMALKEEIEQMKPYIKEIEDNAEALNQSIIQELAETANIANEEDIQKVNATIKEMKDALDAEGINLSEEDRDELIDQYLSGLGNKVINRALAEQELIQDGVSEAVAEAFLNLNLSDEELIAFIRLGFRVNDYETVEALMEAVENYQVLAKNYNLKVDIPLEFSADINKANFNGEEISEDLWKSLEEPLTSVGLEDTFGSREEFNNKPIEERIYLMDQLNKKVAEYSAEIIAVSEEERKLAQEQIETNQKEIDSNEDKIKWLEEHSFLRAHNEEYQKEFEELTQRTELLVNANKELEASINAQAAGESYLKAEINDVLGDIDRLKTSISLIGEDWTVPVENVEQFAALMPEIINQVQELQWTEEGGIKLTQEQIDLILNGNQQILESNKQIAIDAIENKVAQLQAEKQYHEKNIEYLKMALEDKSKANKAMEDMDKNTQEYNTNLKEMGVQVDSEAWTQMVQHSYDGSLSVVENLDEIDKKIKVIHENYNKMLVKDADMGDYNFEGALANIGDQSWTSSVKIDSAWEEDDKNYQALINQLDIEKATVESIDKSIAEYLGAEAKIRASNKEIEDAIKGGPESSSKDSSKEKEKEFKDYLDDVEDRYYDINNAISAVNEELEKQEQLEKQLSSLQSHYAGKTLIDSLKQENTLIKNKNGLLEKQFANYEKIYDLQAQELADLKAQIGGEWEGNMLQNYTELFQANLDAYNSAIDTYNAMSAEQQEESGKQMIEDAKTAYDEYKDALERYQDLYYNEMYDTENKLAELRQQQLENQIKIIENNLKGWEIEVDLKLDKTDLERDLNDFFNEVQQDFRKIYKNISIDSTFDTKNFDTYLTDVETRMSQIRDVEAEIDKMNRSKDANGNIQLSDDMMFGSIEEAQEKLKELQKELTSTGKNLQDLYEQVWDNYIDGLDQAKDNFEDLNKEFKHLTNELEYEKELIELVYGDKAFDLMNKYYTTQQRSIENQIASTRTQAEFWEDQFNKAYQMNRDKHNVELEDMSTWTEDMRKAYDEMISSQEQLNDLVIEGIKNVKDEYLNNVAKTFSDMDKALWGMDFTDVKEDWDFIQEKADEYLDDVEGAYQIQTLANKIDNSIAEANSLKAQQKLAALRDDEINFLREKKNLTQDDIDIAEARYQIALKELALEDAQNNKTSMKLTRDTSGNWTYQYVADEEDVQNKQQELLDAYNELYKIADDAYAHAMELAMNTYEEFREKMQEIAEDTTLSEEEKFLKIQELQDLYLPEINAAVENAGLYEQETLMAGAAVFAEVCEQDAEAYLTLTDLQKTLVDEVRDQHLEDYEEIRAAILNDYDEIGVKAQETFEEMNLNSQTATADIIGQWDTNPKTGSVKGAMQDAFDNIVKYTQNFELELMRLEQVSGKVILDKGGVVDDINQVGLKTDEVAYKTNLLADTASANLTTLRNFVNEVEDAWNGVINKIEKAISALQQYLSMMGSPVGTSSVSLNSDWIGEYTKKIKEYTDNNSSSNAGTPTGGTGTSYVKKINSDLIPTQIYKDNGERELVWHDKYDSSSPSWSTNSTSNNEAWTDWMHKGNTQSSSTKKYREDLGLYLTDEDYEYYLKHQTQGTNYFVDILNPQKYATGGYTGEWGDTSGKLAVLHEKELVLNANDTENMLDAVKAVRSISGLNDSISETIAKSISGLVAAAFGINTNNINSAGGDNTSNVYNITAEFPNADDVQTIRDAILSLPNLASQYVYEN